MVKADNGSGKRTAWKCQPSLARNISLAVLLPMILVGVGRWTPVAAAVLDVPTEQALEPGQRLQLPLTISEDQGPRIEISLGVSPEGTSLVLDDAGQLQLEWQSGADLPPETTIELLVRDVDANEYLDSVFVRIRRPGSELESGEGSSAVPSESETSPDLSPADSSDSPPVTPSESSSDIPPKASPETPPENSQKSPSVDVPAESSAVTTVDNRQEEPEWVLEVPVLSPLPNQVVSAGRIINLNVFATVPGELDAVLQVDRLPRNASFEANGQGGRTFRWETSEADQGEHLFRFTAFNPRAPQLRMVREVWMVVGDPSLQVTLPEPVASE